jgi:hypothetical protein
MHKNPHKVCFSKTKTFSKRECLGKQKSRLPSHSDFTGGCGFPPHRLLGLLDLSDCSASPPVGDLPLPKEFFYILTSVGKIVNYACKYLWRRVRNFVEKN